MPCALHAGVRPMDLLLCSSANGVEWVSGRHGQPPARMVLQQGWAAHPRRDPGAHMSALLGRGRCRRIHQDAKTGTRNDAKLEIWSPAHHLARPSPRHDWRRESGHRCNCLSFNLAGGGGRSNGVSHPCLLIGPTLVASFQMAAWGRVGGGGGMVHTPVAQERTDASVLGGMAQKLELVATSAGERGCCRHEVCRINQIQGRGHRGRWGGKPCKVRPPWAHRLFVPPWGSTGSGRIKRADQCG
jgi:hypothetical protein